MENTIDSQLSWLTLFLPNGLAFFVIIHFVVLPTATKLWDFFSGPLR